MALIGVSLILASVVLFCLRRPTLLRGLFGWPRPPPRTPRSSGGARDEDRPPAGEDVELEENPPLERHVTVTGASPQVAARSPITRIAISAPPPPMIQEPADTIASSLSFDSGYEEQTTPRAVAVFSGEPIPSLSLTALAVSSESTVAPPTSKAPHPAPPSPPEFSLMPPPPRPQPFARAAGSSTLPLPPSSLVSPLPNRGGPIPNRSPLGGLAPPPTHSSKPKKPGKEVALAPGHSPLDWARLSGSPGADLRGLPPNSPYLRVTPTLLKKYTGRKGKDAWTVLGGKVYNITPYLPFHPGGEPELLRGAGRDGTKLFGEIHPWVNYEGMLAACLVGIYVAEDEPSMDAMD